jgi:ABC-type transport system involved in multi-copper enzyme maturation permease subunit
MFWYKCWREMRTVILVGIATIAVACLFIVFNQQTLRDHADQPVTYIGFIWKAVYDSFGRDLFVILCIIMGTGGLLQEKAHGTVGFTLALPVSRRHIIFTRAWVGYLGVVAMAFTPAAIVPFTSHYVGQVYPLRQALGYGLLWACCGAVFYSFTLLLAHLTEGEYTATLVAVPALMVYGLMMSIPWLERFPMLNVFSILTGEDLYFFDESKHLLVGPMPWIALLVMLLVSATWILLASRRMQARDF